VYYAGFIWPAQYALLAKIARVLAQAGARLTILSRPTPELRAFLEREPADGIEPFASNRDALRHLAENAAGLLVSYAETVAEMPWIATSYPSKFIEYSHLGLPCAIVAPATSSIGHWAARENYPQYFSPERLDALASWASALRTESAWQSAVQPVENLARGPFNPDAIHAQFEEGLL
jgi:NAD(P)-dependent dehydrogenase (short-subunit alcohol dehydrogenase family)